MRNQALALIFANGLNFIVNFLMSPFLARKLTYVENGTYGQVNLLSGYLVLFFGLGITYVTNLLLVEHKGEEKKIINSNFWIQLFSSLIAGICLFTGGKYISEIFNNPDLHYYSTLFLPTTILSIFSSCFSYYYIYFNKTKQLSIVSIGTNLFKVSLVFYAVNYLHSLTWVLIFINISTFIELLIHTTILRKFIFPFVKFSFQHIKYTLKLSMPYLFLTLIGYSVLYAGGVLLSNQLGVEKYAIYRNGAIEIPFVASLYSSVTAVALPRIATLIQEGNIDGMLVIKRKISTVVAGVIYPIVLFFIFNGQVFINLYLGDLYVESGVVFAIFNIAVLIRINNYSDILTVRKKPMKIIIPNLISLLLGLVLNYFLVQRLGVIGGAIAYVFSLFALSTMLILLSCKELNVSVKDYFEVKLLGKIFFVSMILSFLSHSIIKDSFSVFFIVGPIYFFIVYFFIFKFNLINIELIPAKITVILKKIKFI